MRALLAAAGVYFVAVVTLAHQRPAFPGTLDQHPSIDYPGGAVTDVVTTLLRNVNDGKTRLAFAGTQGFLVSLLEKLDVPVESQLLLFSKTGIQHPFTTPERPRALYFNDRVVVGYIPGAPLIELASQDPRQGVIFQTLTQIPVVPLQTARPERCTGCHLSGNTLFVPGILVRSNYTGSDGRTMPALGNFVIDHRSPLEQRWGGWYVTGTHGAARHMGNAMVTDPSKPDAAIGDATLNRSTLPGVVDVASYPRKTSDIAALMVFDHQGQAMNLLTSLGWETRVARAEGRLDFSKGALLDLARETADYLAFVDEAKLAAPVRGVSEFQATLSQSGPHDRKGRSLRALDLQTRLFTYRCSYMIYSPAFDALPAEAKAAVLARLRELITDRDTIEILDDTKAGWR
ncbi:MAG TPA: hypothetical protein VM096_13090, partial [Vicinamibacterales bacterium]|nr:hypothetical protein [Vicinamibacterales bacterium]